MQRKNPDGAVFSTQIKWGVLTWVTFRYVWDPRYFIGKLWNAEITANNKIIYDGCIRVLVFKSARSLNHLAGQTTKLDIGQGNRSTSSTRLCRKIRSDARSKEPPDAHVTAFLCSHWSARAAQTGSRRKHRQVLPPAPALPPQTRTLLCHPGQSRAPPGAKKSHRSVSLHPHGKLDAKQVSTQCCIFLRIKQRSVHARLHFKSTYSINT